MVGNFVTSINRATPSGQFTSANSVAYTVTFNAAEVGVVAADFQVTASNGDVQATTPVVVSAGPTTYTVQINDIHGSGDLRLDLIDNNTIATASGSFPLGGPGANNGSFQGQTYTIDQADPVVLSINRTMPTGSTTNADSVSYTVIFSEGVTGVDPTDFSVVKTGTIGTTLTQVTPVSSSVYTVTLSGITGNGTLGLDLVDNRSIKDANGNLLGMANGAASFAPQATFATTTNPYDVAVADLNNDMIPDLVVANYAANDISVLLGNGNGTFTTQATFAAGTHPEFVDVVDLNGDGNPDLLVVNYGSNTASILLGRQRQRHVRIADPS